jgi:Flp pilus assembly protein TadD
LIVFLSLGIALILLSRFIPSDPRQHENGSPTVPDARTAENHPVDNPSETEQPELPRSGETNASTVDSVQVPIATPADDGLIAPENKDPTVDLINRGTELLKAGQVEEAIRLYREAEKLNPEDESTHYNLGIALAAQNQVEEAEKHYRRALELYPDYSEAHNNLGNLLASQGQFDEAITHLEAALEFAPNPASVHNNLGSALARHGRVPDAITHFAESVRLDPDHLEARYNLGNAYLVQQRPREALEVLAALLEEHPDFEPARKAYQRAQAQLESPVVPEAIP